VEELEGVITVQYTPAPPGAQRVVSAKRTDFKTAVVMTESFTNQAELHSSITEVQLVQPRMSLYM
jgi:hypothetical protein